MPIPTDDSQDQEGAGYAGTHALLALLVVAAFITACSFILAGL